MIVSFLFNHEEVGISVVDQYIVAFAKLYLKRHVFYSCINSPTFHFEFLPEILIWSGMYRF